MSTRTIDRGDQTAVDRLRLGAVLLDRTGGAWQVLLIRYADQPTRGWFRMGEANGQIYGAAVVADQGPLRILYDRELDLPAGVDTCPDCMGLTQDPETLEPCDRCAGEGWLLDADPDGQPVLVPIALTEAIERRSILDPETPVQAMIPALALEAGMSVLAEPKPAFIGSVPRVRGRVTKVNQAGSFPDPIVELLILDDDRHLRPYLADAVKYSFRPLEA